MQISLAGGCGILRLPLLNVEGALATGLVLRVRGR